MLGVRYCHTLGIEQPLKPFGGVGVSAANHSVRKQNADKCVVKQMLSTIMFKRDHLKMRDMLCVRCRLPALGTAAAPHRESSWRTQ